MIFFDDESNLCSDAQHGTTRGVKGETPVVAKTGHRFSLNLISAVSPMGEPRCMVTDQRVNAAAFIDFLRRLLVNAARLIYMVRNGRPLHRSKEGARLCWSAGGQAQAVFLAALFAGAELRMNWSGTS
jgi:hypothetical protein